MSMLWMFFNERLSCLPAWGFVAVGLTSRTEQRLSDWFIQFCDIIGLDGALCIYAFLITAYLLESFLTTADGCKSSDYTLRATQLSKNSAKSAQKQKEQSKYMYIPH